MNIDKINSICESIEIEKNSTHTCGECRSFSDVDGGVCFRHQKGVRAWDNCCTCGETDFISIFDEEGYLI